MENLNYKYWGKVNKDNHNEFNFVIYHAIDCATVAKVYLRESVRLRKVFSSWLNMDETSAINLMCFLISLHDIGKIDIRYQSKVINVLLKLQPDINNSCKINFNQFYNHGEEGFRWISSEISHYNIGDKGTFLEWIKASCGHHGIFPQDGFENPPPFVDEFIKEKDKDARFIFVKSLKNLFTIDKCRLPKRVIPIFAGFCSICDWIGSDTEFFPYLNSHVFDLKNYHNSRIENAEKALRNIGIVSKRTNITGMSNIFPDKEPRGIQKSIDLIPGDKQSFTIIEESTGVGKTEIAITVSAKLISTGIVDSIVFALPTQASTNEKLSMIQEIAGKIFKEDINITLAHGKSSFNKDYINLKKASHFSTNNNSNVQCLDWFSKSKKRAFLSQLGVCTIDQVLLSVLPVKHYFIRTFGLGKSVLIIDEIHAYDNYMYGLLTEVIRIQKESGGSVILLSATLSKKQKNILINAWGENRKICISKEYPLITHLNEEDTLQIPGEPQNRIVSIDKVKNDGLIIPDKLLFDAYEGAKREAVIGIICNTVIEAQRVAKKLKIICDNQFEIDVYHSRFLYSDRLVKEKEIIHKYGEKSKREGKIIVSTQVIEQSLNLDFDWLITQLCPIDLLIQRIGRLHRFDLKRPLGFETPKVTVVLPEKELAFGSSAAVYNDINCMWRTQQLLEGTDQIQFPEAYRDWIYEVYDKKEWKNETDELKDMADNFNKNEDNRINNAKRLVRGKDTINPFNDYVEDVTSLTRDSEMSVDLILTEKNGKDEIFFNGICIESLREWEKYESYNMNSVPVPARWKRTLEPYEDGYRKLIMEKIGKNEWESIQKGFKFKYSKKLGLERIKM